jgi:hypothetical protein
MNKKIIAMTIKEYMKKRETLVKVGRKLTNSQIDDLNIPNRQYITEILNQVHLHRFFKYGASVMKGK